MIISIVTSYTVEAQQITFTGTYSPALQSSVKSLKQTLDNGFIMTGFATDSNLRQVLPLVRLNENGVEIWNRIYQFGYGISGSTVLALNDGSFIIAGKMQPDSTAGEDLFLFKVNDVGDSIWLHTYNYLMYDEASALEQTADSGFLLTGSGYPSAALSLNSIVINTNADGDTNWTRSYGDSLYYRISDFQILPDNNILITGTAEQIAGNRDMFYAKLDSTGLMIWQKFNGGVNNDYGVCVSVAGNGNYYFAADSGLTLSGGTMSQLICTDTLGNINWQRTYAAAPVFGACTATADNGIFVAGNTWPVDHEKLLLMKTDSLGVIQWFNDTLAAYGSATSHSVIQTNDGGYIAGGSSTDHAAGITEMYLVKLDSSGQLTVLTETNAATNVTVYPNPVTSVINVRSQDRIRMLSLYADDGELIKDVFESNYNCMLNVGKLASGIYFLRIQTDKGVMTRKLFKD